MLNNLKALGCFDRYITKKIRQIALTTLFLLRQAHPSRKVFCKDQYTNRFTVHWYHALWYDQYAIKQITHMNKVCISNETYLKMYIDFNF